MSDIVKAIRMIAAGPDQRLVPAIVISVDDEARTVDVDPVDGAPTVYDVRLTADGRPGFVVLPEVGAAVVIGWISRAAACVVGFGESQSITATVKTAELEVTAEGTSIKKGRTSLATELKGVTDQLDQLCTKLVSLQTVTPVGPGVIQPAIAAEIGIIQTALKRHASAIQQVLK